MATLAASNPLKVKATFKMTSTLGRRALQVSLALVLAAVWMPALQAETCQTATDMDEATRSALTSTGQRYFDLFAKGDTATLRQSAIAGLASDFSGIEETVKGHQQALAGAHATPRPPFVLDASGTATIPHAEFFCGVFGKSGQTTGSAVFNLNNLPPGKYAVVILDAMAAKAPAAVSLILQQVGADWKLAGLYVKTMGLANHDGEWFAARAREYKTKGEAHNAWFYYLGALSLGTPIAFMSTAATDKLWDEAQKLRPTDVPADGKTADLAAGSTTYKLVDIYPDAVGSDLDLIVKYQVSDISNTNLTYQSNIAVMKALLAKYPEIRPAFGAIVARAVDPSGKDYGTLLAMKDIK
jgi:hypothetical protein